MNLKKKNTSGGRVLLSSCILITAGFFSFFSTSAFAADSLVISSTPRVLHDADEYFTDVYRTGPKNFNSTCDRGNVGWYYAPETIQNGFWTGHHFQATAPIVGVIPIPTLGTNLAVERTDCAPLAQNDPINASYYDTFAFKMKNSSPSGWNIMASKTMSEQAYRGVDDFDGYVGPMGTWYSAISTPANTWVLHQINVAQRFKSTFPWAGQIFGLSLWTSFAQPQGGNSSLDYVRLVNVASGDTINFSYSIQGNPGNYNSSDHFVSFYAYKNGEQAIRLLQLQPLSGNVSIKTAGLDPGTYTFFATVEQIVGQNVILKLTSNSISQFQLNGKPVVRFTSPDYTSGEEYSRDVLGNAWDMNDASDIVNLTGANATYRGFHGEQFSNGYFTAITDEDPDGNINTEQVDTHIQLNVSAMTPINTNKFRYFCINTQVSSQYLARNGNAALLNETGWVFRLFWTNRGVQNALGGTGPTEYVEKSQTYPDYANGFVTYCMDMHDARGREIGPDWKAMRRVNVLRFDPLEALHATGFAINWVGLFAENKDSADKKFTIRWTLNDPENDLTKVDLYSSLSKEGASMSYLGTVNMRNGDGSFVWDTTNVAPGRYTIQAVSSDGVNTSRHFSYLQVEVGNHFQDGRIPTKTPCDYDGDGMSDLSLYRAGSSQDNIFAKLSSNGSTSQKSYTHFANSIPTYGDHDGDNITDLSFNIFEPSKTTTFITYTSVAQVVTYNHPATNTFPVNFDYDGDGQDDFAVFKDGLWYLRASQNGLVYFSWGTVGDIPVPADYDGDGSIDPAIWRPSTGEWYALRSSSGYQSIIVKQFGMNGDNPVQGDYDGDRRADLAVFRPSNGTWYICYSGNEYLCDQYTNVVPFGLAGDYALRSDFDGDTKQDIGVFRPSNATWYYIRSSDGQTVSQSFGLSSDIPACSVGTDIARLTQSNFANISVKTTSKKPTKKPTRKPTPRRR